MDNTFKEMLEKGEKVIKTYKPNRKKFRWSVGLIAAVTIIGCVFWIPLMLLDEEAAGAVKIVSIIAGALTLLTIILTILFATLYYRKRLYAYTNRRVLIRGGIIGVDYKSLQLSDLNATKVYVSWLDKLVRQNTGTIRFGSPSAPLVETGSGASNPYIFAHIEKPYEVMREIREYIDTNVKK